MWFWWFMLLTDMLVPIIMIVAGRLMWRRCPKTINGLYGYRTSRSMKNTDTWRYAHDYAGRLWWTIGWIILVPTILAHVPFYSSNEDTIGLVGLIVCTIHIVILIASTLPVEAALKRTFNDDGTRKNL